MSTRELLLAMMAIMPTPFIGSFFWRRLLPLRRAKKMQSETFIARVASYDADISAAIRSGFHELGITHEEVKGKRILLKPNMVETHEGTNHINTHPMVVRAAIEAFLAWGSAEVLVAEGPGHCRDSLLLLEESELIKVLSEDQIRFVDLNYDQSYSVSNIGRQSCLKKLYFPETLKKVDWIVSMPKMKTHHYAGVTLSMKNLFGIMPGSLYGWPKNVLHWAGINQTILDIYATLNPHFAIVDGIIGMDGDGPIMGNPRTAGVLVMGRSFPAVDATCARIMGINPYKLEYLKKSNGWLGTIYENNIRQKGETISSVTTKFELVNKIPAHKGIRLSEHGVFAQN